MRGAMNAALEPDLAERHERPEGCAARRKEAYYASVASHRSFAAPADHVARPYRLAHRLTEGEENFPEPLSSGRQLPKFTARGPRMGRSSRTRIQGGIIMSLRINQNIAAMNAYRNLSVTDGQMSKSLEKLSSGFRINRAADDAAGLAISEGLRSQVGGLKVAVRNAQDGISVVQTAEGALTETHSILQRMRDLAVQGSNDGGLDTNAEVEHPVGDRRQLKASWTASPTRRRSTAPSCSTATTPAPSRSAPTRGRPSPWRRLDGKGMDTAGLGVSGVGRHHDGRRRHRGSHTARRRLARRGAVTTTAGDLRRRRRQAQRHDLGRWQDPGPVDAGTPLRRRRQRRWRTSPRSRLRSSTSTVGAGTVTAATAGTRLTFAGAAPAAGAADGRPPLRTSTSRTPSGASAAITTIDTPIKTVSTTRANLGAVQNRFEHTVNNLNVAVENLSASESRIRDTDMASEMVNFTRSQILSQAGTAMLAQANQASQGVLRLLQ